MVQKVPKILIGNSFFQQLLSTHRKSQEKDTALVILILHQLIQASLPRHLQSHGQNTQTSLKTDTGVCLPIQAIVQTLARQAQNTQGPDQVMLITGLCAWTCER